MIKEISFKTNRKIELIDITGDVKKAVKDIDEGLCHLFVPHATAAIILQEAESNLMKDIENKVEQFFFKEGYLHNRIDDNAAAHIVSSLIGTSKTIPIKNGKLMCGAWQNILFFELDGPRNNRRVIIQAILEKDIK